MKAENMLSGVFLQTPKVFCIGFHKTGTTSMANALERLGYRVARCQGRKDPDIASAALEGSLKSAQFYDAFVDNPWPILFKELDKAFPGSKFILTIRSSESWIRSILAYFGHSSTPMREWIYGVGSPVYNERIYLDRYNCHNAEVLDYFKNRTNDLLIMDLTIGDGWDKLCPFLGVEPIEMPFPHANQTKLIARMLRRPRIRVIRGQN